MGRTLLLCVLLLALDPWPRSRLRPHRATHVFGQQYPENSDSPVVVCDAISCEMDCRKKTKDCGVYGCAGVCIGYACRCFSKPKPPPGGWKEYNPAGDSDDAPNDQGYQPVGMDSQQQAVQAHMQMQQQHPMQMMQLQPL